MKLFKNILFVLAVMTFGCNGADASLGKEADFFRRRTKRFFPGSYMIPKDRALGKERLTAKVDPAVERVAEEWKQRRWDKLVTDLIRDGVDPHMARDIAQASREDARAREAQEIAQASREDARAREAQEIAQASGADESAEEAQRAQRLRVARFKNRLKPVTIVKEDPWFTAQRNAQARREAQERFDRGPFTISSESEQELVDSPTSEEEAAKIEQLLQNFDRADRAGTIPDAEYEVMQKSGLMDDQRRVLDYDKLGEFLLQKSWYE